MLTAIFGHLIHRSFYMADKLIIIFVSCFVSDLSVMHSK